MNKLVSLDNLKMTFLDDNWIFVTSHCISRIDIANKHYMMRILVLFCCADSYLEGIGELWNFCADLAMKKIWKLESIECIHLHSLSDFGIWSLLTGDKVLYFYLITCHCLKNPEITLKMIPFL